ncbi:MAG: chaperonin GroEL [Chloroflexi bacterium]|nr:chaperonin GroEL [Chloroflexota bacterium]
MPKPEVLLGEDGRTGMLEGFNSMGRLLALTLGPIGANIANSKHPLQAPELLTDAATIARRIIEIENRTENVGAMMMRHLAWNVREEVGDGSATTAVLAQAIANEFNKVVVAGANPMIVRRGVEKATETALKALDGMSIPLEGEERIAAVATAATGNAEIGKLLGELYDTLGNNANIVCTAWVSTKNDRAYHEGARFKGGYLSPYMLTDTQRRVAVLDDVNVVATDMIIDNMEVLQRILELATRGRGKNLFIICERMSEQAMGILIKNNERGTIKSAAAKLGAISTWKESTLEDIGLLVGSLPVATNPSLTAADIKEEHIGYAERVFITRDDFTIIGGKGDKDKIRERVRNLRDRLRKVNNMDDRNTVREMLSHFSAGVGELQIGALTEGDRNALKTLAEQAMKTVMEGMDSGIVPGGGAAYLTTIPAVLETPTSMPDESFGVHVIAKALEEPMRRIAINADCHAAAAIAESRAKGPGYGLDVRSKQVVDMTAAGIVDPTLVVKRALQLASSGAAMLLSTDTLILRRKPEESPNP